MLTVRNEFTRVALPVTVATTMSSAEVHNVLCPLLLKHDKPEYLRSHNRPEFSSWPFRIWLKRIGITLTQIYLGSLWENGHNTRVNGTLRRDVLKA